MKRMTKSDSEVWAVFSLDLKELTIVILGTQRRSTDNSGQY